MNEPDDPSRVTALTHAVIDGVPDRLRDVHTRHRTLIRWYDGPPQRSADTLVEEIRAIGEDFAFNVKSLGMTVRGAEVVSPSFVVLHGGQDMTVTEVCAVLAGASVQAVRQGVARIEECVTLEQVDMVLLGLVEHFVGQVATVHDLLALPRPT